MELQDVSLLQFEVQVFWLLSFRLILNIEEVFSRKSVVFRRFSFRSLDMRTSIVFLGQEVYFRSRAWSGFGRNFLGVLLLVLYFVIRLGRFKFMVRRYQFFFMGSGGFSRRLSFFRVRRFRFDAWMFIFRLVCEQMLWQSKYMMLLKFFLYSFMVLVSEVFFRVCVRKKFFGWQIMIGSWCFFSCWGFR